MNTSSSELKKADFFNSKAFSISIGYSGVGIGLALIKSEHPYLGGLSIVTGGALSFLSLLPPSILPFKKAKKNENATYIGNYEAEKKYRKASFQKSMQFNATIGNTQKRRENASTFEFIKLRKEEFQAIENLKNKLNESCSWRVKYQNYNVASIGVKEFFYRLFFPIYSREHYLRNKITHHLPSDFSFNSLLLACECIESQPSRLKEINRGLQDRIAHYLNDNLVDKEYSCSLYEIMSILWGLPFEFNSENGLYTLLGTTVKFSKDDGRNSQIRKAHMFAEYEKD